MEKIPTIRELYPQFSEEEQKEAEENLKLYVELALRIYERISKDLKSSAQNETLTGQDRTDKINNKGRFSPPKKN